MLSHAVVLGVEVILLLHFARLVNAGQLSSAEGVDHVGLFLLDAADPLAIIHDRVCLLRSLLHLPFKLTINYNRLSLIKPGSVRTKRTI